MHPFSGDVTHDEERSVLPPLQERPPIYTFYEPLPNLIKEVQEAEERLIFQWRRAWWAQGFKPVVLGRADALLNPLYKKVQVLQLQDNIDIELARWLAWGNMGGGILAEWVTFPMAKYGNPLLAFLRRGEYPKLTRYEGLKSGLYCGNQVDVNNAIEKAIKERSLKQALDLSDLMFTNMFSIDSSHDGVARYDSQTIVKEYKEVATPLFDEERARGLRLLGGLINAHLHGTFQGAFPEIAVLKPLAKHTTSIVDPALAIARNLTSCPPTNPIQGSCPPNQPKCRKCISSIPISITTPPSIRNSTEKFFIGTVPHPYTTVSLTHERSGIDGSYVRRLGFAGRDAWLTDITVDALKGTNANKISVLKVAIASDWAAGHTLWMTAEEGVDLEELQWNFGFAVPHEGVDARDHAKSETPVPGPERRPAKPEDKDEGKQRPDNEGLLKEHDLLAQAKQIVAAKGRSGKKLLDAVEGWNMGDIEVWRFVRAYNARMKMVRINWEKEEKGFAGSGKREGSRLGRWLDS
jgi:hypothetical protein